MRTGALEEGTEQAEERESGMKTEEETRVAKMVRGSRSRRIQMVTQSPVRTVPQGREVPWWRFLSTKP